MDLSSARVSGNIDRRQMAELPLQGRNWMELSLMVKGITANNIGNTPGVSDDQFQLNLDGQQISQRISGSGFGQPKMSREAIAEFQIVTNMYDITQGRSTGVQVQAVSRSGTNDLHGSAFGFFRSDKLNAADPVKRRRAAVLGSADRLHARRTDRARQGALLRVVRIRAQPVDGRADADGAARTRPGRCRRTRCRRTTWPACDYQQSSKNNFSVRLQRWELDSPFQISSGTTHPTMAEHQRYYSTNLYGTWTRVRSTTR